MLRLSVGPASASLKYTLMVSEEEFFFARFQKMFEISRWGYSQLDLVSRSSR